jgi:hypothetical protein
MNRNIHQKNVGVSEGRCGSQPKSIKYEYRCCRNFAKTITPTESSSLPKTLWLKKEDEKRGGNFA